MTCPYLDYRRLDADAGDAAADATDAGDSDADAGDAGDADAPPPSGEPRAFCTIVDEFVQPMRADICNDRYALDHATHCEIYREHEGTEDHAEGEANPAEGEGP